LIKLGSRPDGRRFEPGLLFLFYLAASALARIFLETFRGDGEMVIPFGTGSLHGAQVAAWVVLALSLWLIGKRYPYSPKPPTI
jgi:prolipoprotein diacylglyceryltransferase